MDTENAEVQKEEMTPEMLKVELEQTKATKERLLKESKDYAAKYRSLRDEVDQKEKIALEKSENHRALYEKAEEKTKELESSLEMMKKKMKEKEFLFQIAKHAPDARDVLLVAQKLPKEVVQWNDDDMTFLGIEEGLKTVRKSCAFLFDEKKVSPMVNAVPSQQKAAPKTIVQMNASEKKEALGLALETILNKGK